MAADVRVGDRLLTSGLGGRFPPGFPVGTVTAVAPAPNGLFLEAHAQPSADIDRSDEVLLLHDQAEPAGPPSPAAPSGPPPALAPAASATSSVPAATEPSR
jgi:rod shape-determining protein MreC